jgi:threonine aldolase
MTRQTSSPSVPQDDRRQFASDTNAGICPEAWDALVAANRGHLPAYGDDPLTQRACDALRELFETDCEVFFVASGTAANALALASLCQSYHAIVCHELAHIETDECGAPEFFSNGTKLLLVEGEAGKVRPDAVQAVVRKRSDVHYPQPRVLSVTQATELGTVYRPDELGALGDLCRRLGLRLHMDGARFANAVATLGVAPKEITWQAGVDVLSFGGAKNGLPLGDAVVFFRRELADGFEFRTKQAGHLLSKLRFIAAPWVGLLESGAWLRNAQHANQMAQLLADELRGRAGIEIMFPRESNAVFIRVADAHRDALRELGWHFYDFIGAGGARLMCSWDTSEDDVHALASDLRALVSS